MNINLNVIGENAGIVWRTLHDNHLSWEELVKATGLSLVELASAIGWLARENKIFASVSGGIMYFEVYNEVYY